jgi:hypothetical protein
MILILLVFVAGAVAELIASLSKNWSKVFLALFFLGLLFFGQLSTWEMFVVLGIFWLYGLRDKLDSLEKKLDRLTR